jgi:Phage integrase, N-terminal SAM-like domain
VHTVLMALSALGGEPPGLPAALSAALAAFCRHLAAERALSSHTARAYNGDVQSLLRQPGTSGVPSFIGGTTSRLSSWASGGLAVTPGGR